MKFFNYRKYLSCWTVSNREHFFIFLKELNFLLNTAIYLGDWIAVDMEIGPLGWCVPCCQFLLRLNNLSPFKVWQLAEILGHMKLGLFSDIKNRPSDHPCRMVQLQPSLTFYTQLYLPGIILCGVDPLGCARQGNWIWHSPPSHWGG